MEYEIESGEGGDEYSDISVSLKTTYNCAVLHCGTYKHDDKSKKNQEKHFSVESFPVKWPNLEIHLKKHQKLSKNC